MTFTAANTNTARFTWTAPAVIETAAATLSLTTVVADALDASAEAAFAALDRLGGDNGDCGGAWVVLPVQKGRRALQVALDARNIRTDAHHTGGLAVYILRNLPCQSRLPRERGCDAFVTVLRSAGFDAYTYSYVD